MDGILTPVLAVSVIGLACAVILSIASKVMAVKVDERFGVVRECLPGANCGACGFAGCDAYAQALIDGVTDKTNLCIPCGADSAKGISEALGLKFEATEAKVAQVKCHGCLQNTSDKMEYLGPQTCAASKQFFSGRGSCSWGCMGFGDCALACPYGAIDIVDQLAHINRDLCIGCGICVRTCPAHIIEVVPVSAKVFVACSSHDKGAVTKKVCKTGCIACRKCEKTCPHGAITVADNLAYIDPEKCTSCGACVEVCPVNAILTHE